MTHSIQIRDQHFILHPTGAMFWVQQAALLVSDLHLGKVAHFRKHGAAIPRLANLGNFKALDEAVGCFNPQHLYFLGDLFHSYINKDWHHFELWVSRASMKMTLVSGNHDIISPLRYERLGIRVVTEYSASGFLLTHHPSDREGYFCIAGHIHPAVRLHGGGRQSLRLPCFYKSDARMILPAFGEFTGTFTLPVLEQSEVYAIADYKVIKI